MKELLEYIVKSLATKPDEVKISEENAEDSLTFNLSVAQEDMGMVIGKSGQTIKAIRRLLVTRAMAENQNQAIRINLQEQQ